MPFKWDDNREYAPYMNSLALMYGKEMSEDCLAIVEVKVIYDGLHCPGLGLEGFKTHGK